MNPIRQAGILFVAFALMMIGPFAVWPAEFTWLGTMALFCYVALAICGAVEATEAACALMWPTVKRALSLPIA